MEINNNMNDKDIHDMEKMQNLYQEVIEEGILGRAAANVKSIGQTAGKYVGGVGRALVGKGDSLNPSTFRLFYKIANLVKGFSHDIAKVSGVSDATLGEVPMITTALDAIAQSQSSESGKAKEILGVYNLRTQGTVRPRTADEMEKLITSPLSNDERNRMYQAFNRRQAQAHARTNPNPNTSHRRRP